MKKFLLALLMVTLVAMPAFASVQNVKVSGDIDSTYLYRDDFDLGRGDTSQDTVTVGEDVNDAFQSVFFTQTRLRVDADLTDNVSTTVALINERPWSTDGDNSTDIDLNLAFVTLREMLYSPLTVVIGRQVFAYGNSFVVDATGTNNSAPTDSGISSVAGDLTKQTAQDAVRLIFDYNPLKLELLMSKINARTVANSKDRDDVDLYGADAVYSLGDSLNTQVEAYFFSRINRVNTDFSAATSASKNDTTYVPGVRVSTNPIEGLNVQGEVAWQRGTFVATTGSALSNQNRNAMGAQFIANYKIPVAEEYKPMAQYVYTYVSGDRNPPLTTGTATQASAEKYNAWDPMFENQGGGKIYNTLFNLTNLHIHGVTLSANPMEDVTLKASWTGLWLDRELYYGKNSPNNAWHPSLTLVQPDGSSPSVLTVRDETDIGQEFDVEAIYNYTEDVQIGANLGWFLPGDLFDAVNDSVASQAIVHANVTF